jgi:hypothetical protein
MECNIKSEATMLIQYITNWAGVTVSQHPAQYLPEGIHIDTGCTKEAIALEKPS